MYKNLGRVFNGDWDRSTIQWNNLAFHKGFIEHFVDGIPWEDTTFFETITSDSTDRIHRWKHSRWVRSKTDTEYLDELTRFDDLYRSIREEGYQKTRTLDEVTVNIGRNGKLIHNNSGSHRLSIAKILELDEIPVRVLVRHRDWQIIRNNIINGEEVLGAHTTHPDLKDLI